jgi:hypothetical protein
MRSLLNGLKTAAQILPAVVQLVRAIEEAVPQRGAGAEKLEIARELVADLYQMLTEDVKQSITLETLLKITVAVVARVVQAFNKLGWPTRPAAAEGQT